MIRIKQNHNITYYLKYIFATLYLTSTYIIGEILGSSGRLGGIILLSLAILTCLMVVFENRGVFTFCFTEYHLYLILFAFFCLVSTLWATNSSIAREKGINQFELFVFAVLLFIAFQKDKNINGLLKVIMWSGFFVSFYVTIREGLGNLINMSIQGQRLNSEFLNANTMGMCAAYAIVITIYFILNRNVNIVEIIMIPIMGIIVAVSGSRKALIIVAFGTLMFLFLRSMKSGKIQSFFKAIIIIIMVAIVFWALLQTPILGFLRERMESLLGFFVGSSTDRSVTTRVDLTSLGMNLFAQHPVLGVGIDNFRLYSQSIMQSGAYAHNNFVEMLADGGVIGFLLYYWLYGVILYRFIRYRDLQNDEYIICITLFIISLALDYAYVSYYSHSTYFYLMLFYLYTRELKTENKTIKTKA